MKTTHNIKKFFALALAMLMCMSITATAFAAEHRQADLIPMDISETNEQIARAGSHSVRFTYSAFDVGGTEVFLSADYQKLEYKTNILGSGTVEITFTEKSNKNHKHTYTLPGISGEIDVNLDSARYMVTVHSDNGSFVSSIDCYLWGS